MGEPESQTVRELEQILAAVTELTGLSSNWSGRVELIPHADFKGRKTFSCDIHLDQTLAGLAQRWSTLIHEALHAVSQGYVPTAYRSFPGWEEGVVERLQRVFRPAILGRLGIHVEAALFEQDDARHLYNSYVEALEELRTFLGRAEEGFYLDLLRMPLRTRPGHVFGMGSQLGDEARTQFVGLFSIANSVLRGFLHGEIPRTGAGGWDDTDIVR